MNTYQTRLAGVARTKSVIAKDAYEAAEAWARSMPTSVWTESSLLVEVQDIDGHVSTFAVEAQMSFWVRMVPA